MSPASQEKIGRLLLVSVERIHRPTSVQSRAEAVKAPHQVLPPVNAIRVDSTGHAEQVSPAPFASVDPDVCVDRQAGPELAINGSNALPNHPPHAMCDRAFMKET